MKTLLLALVLGAAVVAAMRKQGVAVRGRVVCGTSALPANSTKVAAFDLDSGPDPDDELDSKFVDGDGKFELNGYTRELTDIDPVLYVWHDCEDANTPCKRKIKLTLPKKYIISGEPKAADWLDAGVINLQNTFESEKRECLS